MLVTTPTDGPLSKTKSFRGLIICGLLCVLWLLAAKVVLHNSVTPMSASALMISRVLLWLTLIGMWLYSVKVEKCPFLLWPDKKMTFLTTLGHALLILLIYLAGSVIIALFLRQTGLLQHSPAIGALRKAPIPLKLFLAFTAATTEELIFRGYFLPRIGLFFKARWIPLLISAFAFASFHLGYGTVVNVAIPFFCGLLFGWYYQKYRNIKALMICHFLIDLASLMITRHH